MDVTTVEFSSHFIQRMLQKINWPALKSAAESVSRDVSNAVSCKRVIIINFIMFST